MSSPLIMSSPLRVILVDDSESRGEDLLRVLRAGGFEVLDRRVGPMAALDQPAHSMAAESAPSRDSLPRESGVRELLHTRERERGPSAAPRCIVTYQTEHPFDVPGPCDAPRNAAARHIEGERGRNGPRRCGLLDSAALSLWQVDLAQVRAWLDTRCLRNETMLSAYLERHPLALLDSAMQATIVDVNEPTLSLLAADGPEVLMGTCDRLFPLGFSSAWRQLLRAMVDGLSSLQTDAELTAFDGRHFRALISVKLGPDREDLQNTVVSVCDITSLWERELQEQTAQRMEAMRRLTGSIAHDFNNVLTVVRSYARFLEKDCAESSSALKDVGVILDAAERGARLTSQLLAFSRRQTQDLQLVQLNDAVGEAGKTLQRLIGANIVVRLDLAENLGLVRADPSQIEQVLIDLAVNARDAMPTGGRLTIETANVEWHAAKWTPRNEQIPSGSYVMLAVSDAGVGMADSVLSHIFEPFFTTKGKTECRGLGLSSAYGIVKQSGGHITVSSALGKGTTFKVYFPRISTAERTETADCPEGRAGSETILLIEQDLTVREATKNILMAEGYRVLDALDGIDALRLAEARADRIDLLIVDVISPSLSGRPLADQLARIRPETKVLYVSGCKDDAIVHRGILDESTAFLQKPFGPETLCRAVRRALDTA